MQWLFFGTTKEKALEAFWVVTREAVSCKMPIYNLVLGYWPVQQQYLQPKHIGWWSRRPSSTSVSSTSALDRYPANTHRSLHSAEMKTLGDKGWQQLNVQQQELLRKMSITSEHFALTRGDRAWHPRQYFYRVEKGFVIQEGDSHRSWWCAHWLIRVGPCKRTEP